MTERRNMTLEDWAITAMAAAVGIFVGMIMMTLLGLLVSGLWVLVLILLPVFLLQLLFEGVLRGLWYSGKRLLGIKPRAETPMPEPDPTIPWLRDRSFVIGLGFGAVATALLGDIWSFP